jgi:short-subunit dehydrogenase
MSLSFKHAVITGASSGIGAALALELAAYGQRLTLIARRAERLGDVAARCRARGAEPRPLVLDVADIQPLEAALRAADAEQEIDLVIANAGLGGASALAGPRGEDPFRAHAIAAVNFGGVVGTIAPLAPLMMARGRGAIVVVGSMTARVALPQCPTYGASKAAVSYYAHAMRRLAAPAGVSVTLATLGYVETEMSQGLPRPFLMRADDVARRIVAAAAAGRAEITIPWQLALATGLDRVLPRVLVDAMLMRSLPARR